LNAFHGFSQKSNENPGASSPFLSPKYFLKIRELKAYFLFRDFGFPACLNMVILGRKILKNEKEPLFIKLVLYDHFNPFTGTALQEEKGNSNRKNNFG
jgi:hypothetical protein